MTIYEAICLVSCLSISGIWAVILWAIFASDGRMDDADGTR